MASVAKSLIGGIGSILSGPKAPKSPKPTPPAPRVKAADASARGTSGRLKRRKGLSSTVLTFGLGKGSGTNSTGTNILSGIT